MVFKSNEINLNENYKLRPDLVIFVNKGYKIRSEIEESTFSENKAGCLQIIADHDRDGLFAAYENIINNRRIGANIYEMMPTILYIMGLAILEDFDGRVLT